MIQINSHTAERNNQRNATICPDLNFFCHLKRQACSLKHVWFKLFSVNRVACSLVTVIAQAQKDVSRSSSDIVRYFLIRRSQMSATANRYLSFKVT